MSWAILLTILAITVASLSLIKDRCGVEVEPESECECSNDIKEDSTYPYAMSEDGLFPKDVMEIIPRSVVEKGTSNPDSKFKSTSKGDLYVGSSENAPILYRGGAIVSQRATVYYVFYGNWARSSGSDTALGVAILENFMRGYNSSSRFKVNRNYASYPNFVSHVTTDLVVAPSYVIPTYLYGSSLSDTNVRDIVTYAITHNSANWGPGPNPNGLYFVLTSSDVDESTGFCTEYCGWHSYYYLNSTAVKYSFVGNAARCLDSCAAQNVSPNGNAGVDAMISTVAHELDEIVTDPLFTAWYDTYGEESADKCAWTWGSVTRLTGGAYYNLRINTPAGLKNYLVQRQWKISISGTTVRQMGCAMS